MTIIGLSVNEAVSVWRAMGQAGATTYLRKEDVGDELYKTISRVPADPAA